MKQLFLLLALMGIAFLHHFTLVAQTETGVIKKQTPPKPHIVGLDIGVGSIICKETVYIQNYNFYQAMEIKFKTPVFAFGLRVHAPINPYFGLDPLKFNFNCPFKTKIDRDLMNFQFMTGLRGVTPVFLKEMSGYGVVRMGYGFCFPETQFYHGIAAETEIGLNISKYIAVAFSYNLLSLYIPHGQFDESYFNQNLSIYALRIGFRL